MNDQTRAQYEDAHPPLPTAPPTHGMCTACGSVEVALVNATGARDLSHIGESPEYPTGHGCEVCS